jgi:hypothetical protein
LQNFPNKTRFFEEIPESEIDLPAVKENDRSDLPPVITVLTASRYTRYHDGSEELYDHQSNPNEWSNIAALPEHNTIKKEFAAWIPTTNVSQAI